MRASQPALLAAGRVIVELRDQMVAQWADWLGDRMTAAPTIPRPTVEREFRLLLDVISEMVGPLRREVNSVWFHIVRALRTDRLRPRPRGRRGRGGAAVPPGAPHPQPGAGARGHAGPPGHGHHAQAESGHRQGYRGRGRRVHRCPRGDALRAERRARPSAPSTTVREVERQLASLEQELRSVIRQKA